MIRTKGEKKNVITSYFKGLYDVPARFMRPRLVLIFSVLILSLFGCLMIYSAKSIVSMEQNINPISAGKSQFIVMIAGLLMAFGISRIDYHKVKGKYMIAAFVVVMGLLILALTGREVKGATRWVTIAGITFQPSEFSKPYFIAMGSLACEMYLVNFENQKFKVITYITVSILLPIFLVFKQPDKGTTAIICVTLLFMAYLANVINGRDLVKVLLFFGVGLFIASFLSPYSRARMTALVDPFSQRYGNAYQLVQGLIAFGSGGFIGSGVGLGGAKYAYLPEAHNDFILAVIGEETGFLGCVAVVFLFFLILRCGFEIAKYATDRQGMVIASGASMMLVMQFMLNALGVLGRAPLTGKPVPFLSYGGSSLIASYLLFGLIWCVSYNSKLPATTHDRRRMQMSVASTKKPQESRDGFRVIDGGTSKNATNQNNASSRSINLNHNKKNNKDLKHRH